MPRGKRGSKRSTGRSKNKSQNQNQGEQYFYEIGKDNKKKDQGMSESEDMY